MTHESVSSRDIQLLPQSLGADGSNIDPALLEEAAKAGVVFGRKKSKTNPRMRQYIFATRNGVEIFDLPKTFALLESAASFLKDVVRSNRAALIVGAMPAARELVTTFSKKYAFPHVIERWLGGTLTNFKVISGRIEHYITLKADKAAGRLEKYTKKERGQFDKEIERLTRFLGGLEGLRELPKVLIVINSVFHETAVREAKKIGIPVIALMSSDANPESVTHPVPGNDNSRSSIQWFLNRLGKAVEEGVAERAAKTTTVPAQP